MNLIGTGVAVVLLLFATQAKLQKMEGVVVAVNEGDSIAVKNDRSISGKVFKVRLADIDSPDISQSFGEQSRQFTHQLIYGKRVQVRYRNVDRYSRLIGEVIMGDGELLNEVIVRNGYAWHYRVKAQENPTLSNLEYQAWKLKLGLWVQPSPLPPWEFRRGIKVPPPPTSFAQVDYDFILSYGIVGDSENRIYYWPACADYPDKPDGLISFSNTLEAEAKGYQRGLQCPIQWD